MPVKPSSEMTVFCHSKARQGSSQPERRVPGQVEAELPSSLFTYFLVNKEGQGQEHLGLVAKGMAHLYSQAGSLVTPLFISTQFRCGQSPALTR